MKKILATFLAMSMLSFPVYIEAAETITVTTVIPNPEQATANAKYIGVNQGHLDVIFSDEINEETVENVTFKDEDGNSPIGGIYKTVDGNKLTIEFGELKEETDYVLNIPAGVESINGAETDSAKSYTYTTYAKLGIEEDFEEFTDDLSYSNSSLSYFAKFENTDLAIRSDKGTVNATSAVTTDNDRYVEFTQTNTKGATMSIGFAPVSLNSKLFTEGTFLSKVKIAPVQAETAGTPDIRTGRMHEYNFADQYPNGGTTEGLLFFNNYASTFNKTDDEFYDLQLITKKYNTIANGSAYDTEWTTTAIDLNGSNSVSTTGSYVNNKAAGVVSNYSVAQIYNGAANTGNGFKLAYVKTGLFTEPKFLGEPSYDGESYTFTGIINTDLDEETLDNIRIYDAETDYNYELDYVAEERKLSLTVTDKIYDGFEYNISFDGVKSKDGFDMTEEDIKFTHKNENDIVISPEVESYEYNGAENALTLYMNTEIDENTAEDIIIYDLRKNSTEMPYGVNCNGKVIKIKIDYDMYYDCEYKVDISGVKSTEGFGVKDEKSTFTFTHDDENDILNLLTVESISPDPKQIQTIKDGVTTYNTVAPYMSPNQGYIRLKFNKAVDESTVEGIKFTDSYGTEPIGGVYYNVVDNAVEITFGELKPETEYTLKVTKALKGADKAFIDDEIEYKWTTLEKLYVEEDLSGYEVGYAETFKQTSSNPMDFGTNGLVISSRKGYETTVEVKETAAGKKYALITEAVEGKKIHVGWLPMGIKDVHGNTNPLMVEGTFMVKAEVNMHQAAANNDIVVGTLHNWNFADKYSSIKVNTMTNFTEEDGLYNLQLSTRKYNTEAVALNTSGNMTFNTNYDVVAYDMLSGEKIESNYSLSGDTSARDVDSYSVINSYTGSGMSGNGFKFSYIKLGLFMNPEILGEAKFNAENNTVTYQVNTDVNEETVKNAVLTNKITGNPVAAEFTYDAEKRVITANLGETLEYQTNYITDFTKVESVDGFVFTEKYEFRNLLEIEDIVENIEVSNDFNNGYINLKFKNAVTVTNNDISVINPDGEDLDFTVEISGNNALITFVNEYDYVNNYKLTVKKSITSAAHGDLKFESDMEYSFKLDDILSVSAFKKNTSGYSAKISNNTDEAVEAFVTVAVYDEKGRVLNAVFDVYNIAKGEQKTVSANLTQVAGAKKAKVFVLSNQPELDTMYKALTLELN